MGKELNDVMISELKRAREIVKGIKGHGGYICLALLEEYTTEEGGTDERREAIGHLCDYIEDVLQGASYWSWLDLHCEAYFVATHSERVRMTRAARLAWIDAMIAALEKGERLPEKPSLPSDYKGEV